MFANRGPSICTFKLSEEIAPCLFDARRQTRQSWTGSRLAPSGGGRGWGGGKGCFTVCGAWLRRLRGLPVPPLLGRCAGLWGCVAVSVSCPAAARPQWAPCVGAPLLCSGPAARPRPGWVGARLVGCGAAGWGCGRCAGTVAPFRRCGLAPAAARPGFFLPAGWRCSSLAVRGRRPVGASGQTGCAGLAHAVCFRNVLAF
jgi:hypothetical protein